MIVNCFDLIIIPLIFWWPQLKGGFSVFIFGSGGRTNSCNVQGYRLSYQTEFIYIR